MATLDMELRKKGIGGSEIGAILGMSEYSSPYKVWLEKTGRESNGVSNKYTEAGLILEGAVAEYFQRQTKHRIIKASADQKTVVHPKYQFALGTPDRRYIANARVGKGILECKTTQKTYDDVSEAWFCQLQWYLGIMGLMYGAVAWLERGLDFKYREYEFDREFFEFMIDTASRFWNENVLKDIPPEPLNTADVERMFQKHREGAVIQASAEITVAHEKLVNVKETIKQLEEQEEELTGQIKFYMRDAEAVMHNGKTLFTWKASKPGTTFDRDRFKLEHPDLWEQYQKAVEGSRRFLVK